MIRIKAYRARAYFYSSTGNETLALSDIEMAISKIRRIIKSYAVSESSYIVAQLVRPVFNLGVEISIRIFEQSGDRLFFYRAMQYSDEAKRMSLQAMNTVNQQMDINRSVELIYRNFYATRQKISAIDSLSTSLPELIEDHSVNRKRVDSVLGYVVSPSQERKVLLHGKDLKTGVIIFHDFGDYSKTLNIQGDGELMGLPFGVLINEAKLRKRNKFSRFKDLPYMICEHPINYIGSLTINDNSDNNIGKSRISKVQRSPGYFTMMVGLRILPEHCGHQK